MQGRVGADLVCEGGGIQQATVPDLPASMVVFVPRDIAAATMAKYQCSGQRGRELPASAADFIHAIWVSYLSSFATFPQHSCFHGKNGSLG